VEFFRASVIGFLLALCVQALAVPNCLDDDKDLPVNNTQVLEWKLRTPSGFKARGHILGRALRRYSGARGHEHFSVRIGNGPKDTIEIVYNTKFGTMPAIRLNDVVEACGDYITSNRRNGHYPPSPDGAILHWVHVSDSVKEHEHGFVAVGGHVTGVTPSPD
jgi:hypothetical protein